MIKNYTHTQAEFVTTVGLFINFLRLIQKMLLNTMKKITEKLKTQFILTIKKK